MIPPRRTIRRTALTTLALTVLVTRAVPSGAGIADSPLPVLQAGATTYHLYSVPSAISTRDIGPYFGCTSTDTATMKVGVELFGSAGGAPANDAVATSLSVGPGATVVFGRTSVGIPVNSNPGIPPGALSARILATSKKLVCAAFLADPNNSPPMSMVYLTIIAKTKQKAAN